jgi:RHS repeat-associated protein
LAALALAIGILALSLLVPSQVLAQATCGAAGGPPAGPGSSVCDFADEATGLRAGGVATGAGNPVDLVTGNKYRHEVDLRASAIVPFVLARHYNSRNRFDGPLGVGWSHSFETRIVATSAGKHRELQIIQGDGRRVVFRLDRPHAGQWQATRIEDGIVIEHRHPQALDHDSDRALERELGRKALRQLHQTNGVTHDRVRWTWRWPGGRSLHFDARGRLLAVLRDGMTMIRLHHGESGRLEGLIGPDGWRIDFEYIAHPHGTRIARVLRNGTALVDCRYDATGQLAEVQWPDGRRRRYEYRDSRDPLLLTEVFELEPEPHAPVEQVASYRYDEQGRAIGTTETDSGSVLEIHYQAQQSRAQPGMTVVTDNAGRRAHYAWLYSRHDHLARLIEAQGEACSSCPPSPRRYAYDDRQRLSRVESPQGALQIDRDAVGRPVQAWHSRAPGNTPTLLWRLGYRSRDRLEGPSRIDQPSVAPGRWHRIDIRRDALSRPTDIIESGFAPAAGRGSTMTYAPLSRRFSLGHRKPNDEPPFGGRLDPSEWLSALSWVDGPQPGPSDRLAIGQEGDWLNVTGADRPTEELNVGRRWILQEHRSARGVTSIMLPNDPDKAWLGGPTIVSATNGRQAIDFDYQPFGKLAAIGRQDFTLGREVRVRPDDQPNGPSLRAVALWRGLPSAVALPDGSLFSRGFDDFGRVAFIDQPGEPRQWAQYDAYDRLVTHHPGDGSTLAYRRDAAGRLIESTRLTDGRKTLLGRYTWRGADLIEAANDTVSIRYSRDHLGRLTGAEHRFMARPDEALRYQWHYNIASRVTGESLPDGVRVHYRYRDREVVGLTVEGLGADAIEIDAEALRAPLSLSVPDSSSSASPGAQASAVRKTNPVFIGGHLVAAAGSRYSDDPHGRRAIKQSTNTVSATPTETRFMHQDWRLRGEQSVDGGLRHWLWAGSRPVALIASGRLYRIVTDERGAPVRALNDRNQTVWSARYDRLGQASIDPGAQIDINLRLPGQYFDAESAWHYNHARTYDPSSGHYLEADPLGLQPGYRSRDSLRLYADGDPITGLDPWGLARLTWFALTTDSQGRSLGQTQGFDRARWSFMIEDILPVPLFGNNLTRPQPSGIDGLLFDPWGDFIAGQGPPKPATGNGVDAIAWTGATGRQVFASFAAHYGGALASPARFVIEGFDDVRAGALALILSASPSQRRMCIDRTMSSLPGIDLGPGQPLLTPSRPDLRGPARVLECRPASAVPVTYQDELERSRVERYQAAAELQESPSASINENCAASTGCRSRARIDINGHAYYASYGRTQFTVTTFLAELMRLTDPSEGEQAAALRNAVGLDAAVTLDGRAATMSDALALARRRVDAAYRAFAALRREFGRGLDSASAAAAWESLALARRASFTSDTGLGRDVFIDMLGYVATGLGARTEEEGRHALAASAAATVRIMPTGSGTASSFNDWLVGLFSSTDAYDHVSRAFLRDNLRRVLSAPALAGHFVNAAQPGTQAWIKRQDAIETELAKRVAMLHNSGHTMLATSPKFEGWLASHSKSGAGKYVQDFVSTDTRGNWEALRCTSGLGGHLGLQLSQLSAMPAQASPGKPTASRKSTP